MLGKCVSESISLSKFAPTTVDGIQRGYAKRFCEKASFTLTMFSYPLVGVGFGRMSIWKVSFEPKSNCGHMKNSFSRESLLMRLFMLQSLHFVIIFKYFHRQLEKCF